MNHLSTVTLRNLSSDISSDPSHTVVDIGNDADLLKPPAIKTTCWGRVFNDPCSQIPMAGVGIASGITALVLFILNSLNQIPSSVNPIQSAVNQTYTTVNQSSLYMYAVASVLAFAGIALIAGCLRIACLKPIKTLEKTVDYYASQNIKIGLRIQELKTAIQTTENERVELNQSLQIAQENIKSLNKSFDSKITDLNEVTEKLQLSQEAFKTANELYIKLKQQTVAIAENIHALNETGKSVHETSSKVNDASINLSNSDAKLSGEIEEFSKENDQLEKERNSLTELLKGLNQDISQIEEKYNETKNDLGELRLQIRKMQDVQNTISTSDKSLENVASQTEKLLDQLTETVNQINNLDKEKK